MQRIEKILRAVSERIDTLIIINIIDQMEHEGWVDKIPKLGFWAFFNSYVYMDWEKAIFFI